MSNERLYSPIASSTEVVPLLSVITVNLDSGDLLRQTHQSLRVFQECGVAELVVIDGGSCDASGDYLRQICGDLDVFVSEPDRGIYDAMNKGLARSRGTWIWFVNAGEQVLVGPEYLARELTAASKSGDNLLYADVLLPSGKVIAQRLSLVHLARSSLNHQNCLFSRDLLGVGYDASFRLCADYFLLLCRLEQIRSRKLAFPICRYDMSGQSSSFSRRVRFRLWKERLRAQVLSPLPWHIRAFLAGVSIGVIGLKLLFPRLGSVSVQDSNERA